MNEKSSAVLKNWYIDDFWGLLYGDAYGHPRFDDGTLIRTSAIVSVVEDMGNYSFIVETMNTLYTCMFKDCHECMDEYSTDETFERFQNLIEKAKRGKK